MNTPKVFLFRIKSLFSWEILWQILNNKNYQLKKASMNIKAFFCGLGVNIVIWSYVFFSYFHTTFPDENAPLSHYAVSFLLPASPKLHILHFFIGLLFTFYLNHFQLRHYLFPGLERKKQPLLHWMDVFGFITEHLGFCICFTTGIVNLPEDDTKFGTYLNHVLIAGGFFYCKLFFYTLFRRKLKTKKSVFTLFSFWTTTNFHQVKVPFF